MASLDARKLRHRVVIQQPMETQNADTGDMEITWVDLARVWAAIEPLSGREFIAAQSENNEVTARITVRFRPDINAKMRLYHEAKGVYYNIEGILADKDSGKEYLTMPVSEGLKYQDEIAPS